MESGLRKKSLIWYVTTDKPNHVAIYEQNVGCNIWYKTDTRHGISSFNEDVYVLIVPTIALFQLFGIA